MNMKLYNKIYLNDLKTAMESVVNFETINNQSIMITGASGLIGSFIADVLMYANRKLGYCIDIYALGRSKERLEKRFKQYVSDSKFHCIEHDVIDKINFDYPVDYIIHAASNAYPASFNNDPVGTIMGNVLGTYHLLEYGKNHDVNKFLFISSGEVYGQGDVSLEEYDETYSGYVDPTMSRSCYPASKRAAETLCISYTKQYGLDTVIARPCHSYGPNSTSADNRANVQFINNVINGEDIIMKSPGRQLRSYCYIADCASAVITILLNGEKGEAYNVANRNARITVAGYAKVVAETAGRNVVFKNPDEVSKVELTPIAKAVLESKKLEGLGWSGKYDIQTGIEHTLHILMD